MPSKLQMVQIDIGSTTYDHVLLDVTITIEAALGLIGGTMGLFTGFSILSGIEIIYYLAIYIQNSFRFMRNPK